MSFSPSSLNCRVIPVYSNSGTLPLTRTIGGCAYPEGNYTFSAVAIACNVRSAEVAAGPVAIRTQPHLDLSDIAMNAGMTSMTLAVAYRFPFTSASFRDIYLRVDNG